MDLHKAHESTAMRMGFQTTQEMDWQWGSQRFFIVKFKLISWLWFSNNTCIPHRIGVSFSGPLRSWWWNGHTWLFLSSMQVMPANQMHLCYYLFIVKSWASLSQSTDPVEIWQSHSPIMVYLLRRNPLIWPKCYIFFWCTMFWGHDVVELYENPSI
jgi:hypothetical protein